MTPDPRERGCLGKQSYATKHDAAVARQRMVTRTRRPNVAHKHKGRGLSALSAYNCTICGQWHLGNDGGGKVAR